MSTYAGTLPGGLATDRNGGVGYAIDIEVPPGIAGAAPKLSLVYSSLGGNGPLGIGWSLGGLSLIERVPSTLAQDGFLGGVTFGDTDRLALDQSRLVPMSGGSDYFQADATYETEIQGWFKVVPTYLGTQGRQGPDAFTVYHRDGRVFRYGTTADSQGVASSANCSIRAWYVSSIEDPNGNTISFSYVDAGAGGTRLPSRIDYTSNGDTPARRSVRFTYGQRADVIGGYVCGCEVRTELRLEQVVTFVDEATVCTYALGYEYGAATGRSRIVSIALADSTGMPLPASTFGWQDATPNFGASAQIDIQDLVWGGTFLPMDITGSGRVDFVNACEGQDGELCLTLYLADGQGGFQPPIAVPPSGLFFGGQIVTLDANGDGRTELLYAADNDGNLGLTLFVSAFQDGAWTLAPGAVNGAGPDGITFGCTLLAADVDGDGLADLVLTSQASDGSLVLRTLFSDGAAFAPSSTDRTAPTTLFGGTLIALDANADGMDDLVYALPTSDGANWTFTRYQSTGRDGFVEIADNLSGTAAFGGQLIALDVNADGNTDIVCIGSDPHTQAMVASVLVNDGVRFTAGSPVDTGLLFGGFVTPASLSASASPELLVFTQDSQSRLVVSAFRTSVSGLTPIDGIEQPPTDTLAGGNAMPLDLRGVGFSDIVYAVESAGVQSALVMPALGPYPDLLVSAINGVGGCFHATYSALTDPAVCAAVATVGQTMSPAPLLHAAIGGGSYGLGPQSQSLPLSVRQVLCRTPVPKYVVASSGMVDGIGGAWTTNYRYAGPLIDLSGRGWLGFAVVETDDLDIGTTTRDTFHQLFPLTQMNASSTVTRTSDGGIMTVAEFDYDTPQSGLSWQVLCVSSSTSSYSFAQSTNGPADTVLATTTVYDGYGNVVSAESSGNALAAGSVIVQEYEVDAGSWQLGLVKSRAEYADAQRTQLLREDSFSYDPATRQPVGHGRWNDVAQVWLNTIYAYDEFGNLTSSTDPTGSVKTTTYEAAFNTFPRSTTVSPNSDIVLTETYLHEPAFGRMLSRQDPAGAIRQWVIDGLGRTVSESRTGPDGEVVEVGRTSWSMVSGALCRESSRRLSWVADQWTAERSFSDGLGRQVRYERDPAEGVNPVVVLTSYNSDGAKLTQTLPCYEGAVTFTTRWTYDAFKRVVSAVTPAADGTAVLTSIDYPAVGTARTTVAAGTPSAQVTTVRHAITGGGHVPVWRQDNATDTTSYAYDGLGNLLSLTDPSGIVTSAVYDTLGRQVSTSIVGQGMSLGRDIVYQDLERTAIETTAGTSLMLVRDAANRIVEKRVGTDAPTRFVYDEQDMPFSAGRLTTVNLPSGATLRYGYDADGNQVVREVTVGTTTSTIGASFQPDGQRETTTFPDGSKQVNLCGPAGALTSITFAAPSSPGGTVAAYSGFDAFDHPTAVTLGNGVTSVLGYDVYGRLNAQQAKAPSGAVLFCDAARRDPRDAVIADGDPSSPVTFGYDPVGRLNAVASSTPTCDYDASGNRVGFAGTAVSYRGYAAVEGTGVDPFVAAYDPSGNLVSMTRDGETTTYGYDGEQQIASVSGAGGASASYVYDHAGQRLSKVENGVTTTYVGREYEIVQFPDGSCQHSCVISESGCRDYVATFTETGSPLVTAGVPAIGEAYFVCDRLGSTRVVLDAAGTAVATLEYDPFGSIVQASGSESFRYRFSGREYDRVAEAYYFGARYYDPRLGRFLTPDDQLGGSLIDRDAFNVYVYVLNDPKALIDPTGHSWWDFAGQVLLDTVMITAGVAVIALGGGGANIVGSGLIGAGIGGLSYDIGRAWAGKGADVRWGKWGVSVGIGAATGLLTGGVAVGAGSALATAGVQTVGRCITMALVMGITSSGVCMASTVLGNRLAHRSLTSGLLLAGTTGAAAGVLGGGLSGLFGAAADDVASQDANVNAGGGGGGGQGNPSDYVEPPDSNEMPATDNPVQNAPRSQVGARDQPESSPFDWQKYRGSFAVKAIQSGSWTGFVWTGVYTSAPRLIFGSLRSLLIAEYDGIYSS